MPAVPAIVESAIAAIRSEGSGAAYAENALEKNLGIGLTNAVDRWFATTTPSADTDLHFALGRAQARAARSLDELMGFCRIAARTAWRRLTEVGAAQGIEPEHLYRLAETGFGHVDELSTQAAAGYADEQSHRSGATHSRRAELLRLLLRDPQPDGDVLAAAAHAAGVELSPTLAFFVGPAERLAPLEAIRGAKTRMSLASTLRAWLRSPGQRKTIAESLAVHPQTVRYRTARLRELFGDALDDPDGRFELELALRLQPYAPLPDGVELARG